ncbi:glycosyltransferase [Stenotrophomonas sp. 169]|uniref:glycosyltransferase n=1 Tax=Stenotrophomonas sp. 169 TaxID=2770322 RepID=UPI0016628BA1|nr:glycosyltransferase [Stenotrophomonas sp. 169]QNR95822.1 glycosyltransferase [Stenotrophomonas sp. 169]
MIGVIIPAHNEAAAIQHCLASVSRAAQHPRLRGEAVLTVVALDSCTDATAAVCEGQGVMAIAVNARCVGAARAAAADYAIAQGARWIASTDADTIVPRDWLSRQVGCGADAFCGVVNVADWMDYPDAVRDAFAQRELVRDGHRHIHGANMGVNTPAYLAAGGFQTLSTGEDVALVSALSNTRASIAWHAKPAVLTSARRSARAPHGFSEFLRALEREVLDVGTRLLPTRALQG